jgi:hypothetical protein
MEIASHVFSDVLSPLAAFQRNPASRPTGTEAAPREPTREISLASFLDSAGSPGHPPKASWEFHGADTDGQRLFFVPRFALGQPPLRIDVYIPPPEETPAHLKHVFAPGATIYSPKESLGDLPVVRHVGRVLEEWSTSHATFQAQYLSKPFGSQIIMPIIDADIFETAAGMELIPNYDVEQAMLSVEELQDMWRLPGDAWPDVVDWTELSLQRQPHEAISIVRVACHGHGDGNLVFKSLTRDQKHLYHELKRLLTMELHPRVIPRPLYVVVKKSRFGGKLGVCGFVLPYYSMGSLGHRLDSGDMVSSEEKFRWAGQITEALLHVNKHEAGFYPDLKPDNVVLEQRDHPERLVDAVLLDLEQRGGWFSWSPPEIAYVEYMEILAARLDDETARPWIAERLEKYIPGWKPPRQNERYQNLSGGFSAPWKALVTLETRGEKSLAGLLEKTQVFMLGKLLWCIFESQHQIRSGIDHDILQDPDPDPETMLVFPEFRTTPPNMRALIRACTRGAREWRPGWDRAAGIVLSHGILIPVSHLTKPNMDDGNTVTGEQTQSVASAWWRVEMERAERFMDELVGGDGDGDGVAWALEKSDSVLAAAMARPMLIDVLKEIRQIEASTSH